MAMSLDKALEKMTLSKAEEIVIYILRHTDGDTKLFNKTYKQIQDDLNVSSATVARVFKILESNGGLVRAGHGKWFVPAVVGYEPQDEETDWSLFATDD